MLEDTQASGPAQTAAGAEVQKDPPPASAKQVPQSPGAPADAPKAPSVGTVSLEEDEDVLVQFEDIWQVRDAVSDVGSLGGRSAGP